MIDVLLFFLFFKFLVEEVHLLKNKFRKKILPILSPCERSKFFWELNSRPAFWCKLKKGRWGQKSIQNQKKIKKIDVPRRILKFKQLKKFRKETKYFPFYPLASEASRKVANLTERRNCIPPYMVSKNFSVCMSVCGQL